MHLRRLEIMLSEIFEFDITLLCSLAALEDLTLSITTTLDFIHLMNRIGPEAKSLKKLNISLPRGLYKTGDLANLKDLQHIASVTINFILQESKIMEVVRKIPKLEYLNLPRASALALSFAFGSLLKGYLKSMNHAFFIINGKCFTDGARRYSNDN